MSDASLQQEVLAELGDDRIEELARELGTDSYGARQVVESTVTTLPEALGDGPLAGVLDRLATPTAETVSRQTGLPLPDVTRALELLLPVVLSVIAGRRQAPN
ncbi:DUF937 domain-containing protein [Streptomyces sp. KR80]|uniref:DUF937 domain-containing protein n=1 Tax=Streptomyces sp. KR80 TaxID=3457426 RepID=UPI003FD0CF8F